MPFLDSDDGKHPTPCKYGRDLKADEFKKQAVDNKGDKQNEHPHGIHLLGAAGTIWRVRWEENGADKLMALNAINVKVHDLSAQTGIDSGIRDHLYLGGNQKPKQPRKHHE